MVQKVVCLPNLPLAKSLYDFKMPFLSCSFETESYSSTLQNLSSDVWEGCLTASRSNLEEVDVAPFMSSVFHISCSQMLSSLQIFYTQILVWCPSDSRSQNLFMFPSRLSIVMFPRFTAVLRTGVVTGLVRWCWFALFHVKVLKEHIQVLSPLLLDHSSPCTTLPETRCRYWSDPMRISNIRSTPPVQCFLSHGNFSTYFNFV